MRNFSTWDLINLSALPRGRAQGIQEGGVGSGVQPPELTPPLGGGGQPIGPPLYFFAVTPRISGEFGIPGDSGKSGESQLNPRKSGKSAEILLQSCTNHAKHRLFTKGSAGNSALDLQFPRCAAQGMLFLIKKDMSGSWAGRWNGIQCPECDAGSLSSREQQILGG